MNLLYVGCKSGRDYWLSCEGKAPKSLKIDGERFELKSSPQFAGIAVHAYTLTGEKLHKHEERTYRTNKCAAEGLAKGTHRTPDYRDATGDKQSRESINQFNRIYQDTKNALGKPLIK